MPNVIQVKRGAGAPVPVLSDGEPGWDSSGLRLYVGQGGLNRLVGEADFVKLSGGTMSGSLTLNADPTQNLHAATKQYVDALVQGIDAKTSVRAASTGNLTLSGTQTVDGVVLSVGERILVKDQSTPAQNGIYVVASGAWTRASDVDSWAELPSCFTWVEQGTVNGDTGWLCTVVPGGTLGTTAVTFVLFASAGSLIAGAGLLKTGNAIDIVSSGNGIVVNADNIGLTYGSSANTVCQGNDSRLSDARTPTSHTLASHTSLDHAVNAATYGYGTTVNAGHLRVGSGLSDSSGTVSHAAHTGDVTGATALTIANKQTLSGSGGVNVSNSPTVIAGAAPVITLTYGSAANTVCQGNDSRLSDARPPTSHAHGNIANGGTIGSTSGLPIITGAAGILQAGSFGTTPGTFCQGSDSRLHTQGTDGGTTSTTFQIGTGGVLLKNSGGNLQVRSPSDTGWQTVAAYNCSSHGGVGVSAFAAFAGGHLSLWNPADTQRADIKFTGATNRVFLIPDNAGASLLSDASAIDGGTW